MGAGTAGRRSWRASSTNSASSRAWRTFGPEVARSCRYRGNTVKSASASWKSHERSATCQGMGSPANSAFGPEIGSVCLPSRWRITTARKAGCILLSKTRQACRSLGAGGRGPVSRISDSSVDGGEDASACWDFLEMSISTRRVNFRVSPGGMAPTATTRLASFSPFGSWTSTSTVYSQGPSLPGCRMTPSTLSGQTVVWGDGGRVTASKRSRR